MYEKTGFRLKKRFGQHFIRDKNITRKIVGAAGVKKGDTVVEVGPGQGSLTEGLLSTGARVIAIELDRDLIPFLKEKFSGFDNLELIEADALKVSLLELSRKAGARLKVVSNLPYNISGPILIKFYSERSAVSKMLLMLQKEVAGRITSKPSTKGYGFLTVIMQTFFDVKKEFNVSRNVFRPIPDVDSTVVSLTALDSPRFEIQDEGFFFKAVKASFGQRRKTILNSLKTLVDDKEKITLALETAGIDPSRRAETLTLNEFNRLATALGSK